MADRAKQLVEEKAKAKHEAVELFTKYSKKVNADLSRKKFLASDMLDIAKEAMIIIARKKLSNDDEEDNRIPYFSTLDLSGNTIGDEGTKGAGEIIVGFPGGFETVHMRECGIADDGITYLGQAMTAQLRRQKRSTTKAPNIEEVKQKFKRGIHKLMAANKFTKGAQGVSLAHNSTDELDEGEAEQGVKHQWIRQLDVSKNRFTYVGVHNFIHSLKDYRNLQILDFSDNAIGTLGAKAVFGHLASDPLLRIIRLCRNHIDAGVGPAASEALMTNHHLSTLNLEGNSIQDSAALAIADVIRSRSQTTSITNLNLSENDLSVDGLKKLPTMLTRCRTLKYLNGIDLRAAREEVFQLVPGGRPTRAKIMDKKGDATKGEGCEEGEDGDDHKETDVRSELLDNLKSMKEFLEEGVNDGKQLLKQYSRMKHSKTDADEEISKVAPRDLISRLKVSNLPDTPVQSPGLTPLVTPVAPERQEQKPDVTVKPKKAPARKPTKKLRPKRK